MEKKPVKHNVVRRIALLCLYSGAMISLPSTAQYSLQETIDMAQLNDPWLKGSEYRQESISAQSSAAGQLPDPVISFNLANLPVDSFNLSQEPMTQVQVGISQALPRGDSRSLQKRQLYEISEQQPLMRMDRKAKVAVTVAHLWLDSYRYRESIRLVKENENLFNDLIDIVESRYSSALGNTSQYDLIRAQLELTQFEERLIQLQENFGSTQMLLTEWLPNPTILLSGELPDLHLKSNNKTSDSVDNLLVSQLQQHPAITSIDQQILASNSGVELAEQSYKPQFGINAMYGYRDDDLNGDSQADFFSLGLTMDVPLFTRNRQDKRVQSAMANVEELKTQRALLLRQMRAQFTSNQARLALLEKRQALYRNKLLSEAHAQTEASLTAYTNDKGDFSEVVRARIAELNAHIDALNVSIDRFKTIATLNYFFASSTTDQSNGGSL